MVLGDDLYQRGYSRLLLKCVSEKEALCVLQKMHNGVCGFHSGVISMVTKVLREGFIGPKCKRTTSRIPTNVKNAKSLET